MTTSIEREIHRATKPAGRAPLPQKSRARTGEVQHPQPGARGGASRIRAWRAEETHPSQTTRPEGRAAVKLAASTLREPFGRDAGVGARPGPLERQTRMRAIEQAWQQELARQAQLEAGAR